MLGVVPEDILTNKSVAEMGVDSLMSIEVKNWVEKEFTSKITVFDLTSGKSIDELAEKIISTSTSLQSPPPSSNPSANILVCLRPNKSPTHRLICFPYMGGSAKAFQNWNANVDPTIEIWAYEPSSGLSNWEALMAALMANVKTLFSSDATPLVFYGHSLGALIAFELALAIQATDGFPVVKALIVGASDAPNMRIAFNQVSVQWDDASLMNISRDVFVRELAKLGIVDSVELGYDVLLAEVFLGRRYADWRSSKSSKETTFKGRMAAIGGSKDNIVSGAEGWRDYSHPESQAQFKAHQVIGGHLFVHDCGDDVIKIVHDTLSH